jgi:hypothetical protein
MPHLTGRSLCHTQFIGNAGGRVRTYSFSEIVVLVLVVLSSVACFGGALCKIINTVMRQNHVRLPDSDEDEPVKVRGRVNGDEQIRMYV